MDKHGSRDGTSSASNDGGERRNSSSCTPESHPITERPERQSQLSSYEATKPQPCSSGKKRTGRRLDSQTAC